MIHKTKKNDIADFIKNVLVRRPCEENEKISTDWEKYLQITYLITCIQNIQTILTTHNTTKFQKNKRL